MLFLNISADKVYLSNGEKEYLLDRNGIEEILWKVLVEEIKNHTEILVLNWPGWFTNLRVGCLCINLLNALHDYKIKLYDISKLELYNRCRKDILLPTKGIIYIWQQKNIWLYDFENNSYETITKDQIPDEQEYFLDQVYDQEYFSNTTNNKIEIHFTGTELEISYNKKTINYILSDLHLEEKKQLTPDYMVQPVIWKW